MYLVVKQPRMLIDKYNSALVGRLMDCLVIDGAAWSGNILGARLVCTKNIVDERELE